MKTRTQKLVFSALMASLVCVLTLVIRIPSPYKGYINLGDAAVLLCGWMLSPLYGFFAAGIGSFLADLFSGYPVYAPATFLIKGVMALLACGFFRLLHKKVGNTARYVVGAVIAELWMSLGYFVFEGFLYGFLASLPNLPVNLVQGAAGLLAGVLLAKVFERSRFFED